MTRLERLTLVLRALLEAGIVAGLATWGVYEGSHTWTKVVLGAGAPLLGFGFWGAVDFRGLGRLAEPARLVQELAVSGLAALALFAAGRLLPGIALAALSVCYHALVYASGGRLLKQHGAPETGAAGV